MPHSGLNSRIAASMRSTRSFCLPAVLDVLLVALLGLPYTPSPTSLSVPRHALRKPHHATAVRRCAVSCSHQARPPRRERRDSPAATGRQGSPGIGSDVAAAPPAQELNSEDTPDFLGTIPTAEGRSAPVSFFAACPTGAGAVRLHIGAGLTRAPPTVVA